mmetsp:Transcript_2276/g.3435  ORF Transcript_2276/g.3435 Transcript_2276/m.3435 type:complete len:110 (+) Transcript_2276:1937-2266(+)
MVAGGSQGIFKIDYSDVLAPELSLEYAKPQGMIVNNFHIHEHLVVVTEGLDRDVDEGTSIGIYDYSDKMNPKQLGYSSSGIVNVGPIPGALAIYGIPINKYESPVIVTL